MTQPGVFGRTARVAAGADERPAVSGDRTAVLWTFGAQALASGWR
jgi:hypothetical protein